MARAVAAAGWVAGYRLASCSWLAAWLAACCVADEAGEGGDSGCGWLAGWQPNQKSVEEEHNPSKRNISLSVAELKAHGKNIQKRRNKGR